MIYSLKNGDITCYFESDRGKDCYGLLGISTGKDPGKTYAIRYNFGIEAANCCYIHDFLTEKLNNIISAQLKSYFKAHAFRYDIYKSVDDAQKNKFYSNNLNYIGTPIEKPNYRFEYTELIGGIVTVFLNRETVRYNLQTHEVIADKPLFYLVYKEQLDMLAAKEQLRIGNAPAALTELYRLSKALFDKQTVTFFCKDGNTFTQRSSNFLLNDIFNFTVEAEEMSCATKSCYGAYQAEDIEYIKLGKEKFYFKHEALKELRRPALELAA